MMRKPDLTMRWQLLDGVTALKHSTKDSTRLLPDRKPTKRALLDKVPDDILSRFEAGWNEDAAMADPAREFEWLETLDWLDLLKGSGLVRFEMYCGSEKLLTLIPHEGQFEMPGAIETPQELEAKPFLYARPSAEGMTLNEPDTPVTAILHCPNLRQVVLGGQTLDLGTANSITIELCGWLAALGFLQPKGTPSDISPTWEFHDRLLYSKTHVQDPINSIGATYRFGADPVVVDPPALTTPGIPLTEPSETGRSFTEVLKSRRSIRHIGEHHVTLKMVGELLARAWRDAPKNADLPPSRKLRPFPSGGAIHELELTLLARNVDGLEPGAYRYCSASHQLHPIPASLDTINEVCTQIGTTFRVTGEDPGCMFIISSQLPKLAQVYEKIAMRLTLMNSGAALQTLQLAATDLGLNSWIVGAGLDSDFASAGALPGIEEFPVAAFFIGDTS